MKTTLLVLLLTCLGVWAQTPDGADAESKDAILRRAVRKTVAATETNAVTPAAVPVADTTPATQAPPPGAGAVIAQGKPTLPSIPAVTPRKVPQRPIPALRTNTVGTASNTINPTTNAGTVVNNNTILAAPNTTVTPIPAVPSGTPATATTTTIPPAVQPVPAAVVPGVSGAAPEPIIPEGQINFPGVDINQFLTFYGELVGRTILRPTALPAQMITFKSQTALTKSEAIQALNKVLEMNGITVMNVGEKFVKVLPQQNALQDPQPFSDVPENELPELGAYVARIVQLKFSKPSELMPALQPFAKMPGGILPIDSSQTLIIRDYTENVKRMLDIIEKVDVAVPMDYDTAVIPIKYALASEIASALGNLGGGGTGTTIGQSGNRTGTLAGSGATPGGYGTGTQSGFGTPGIGQTGGIGQPGAGGLGTQGGNRTTSFTDRLRNIMSRASGPAGDFQILGNNKIIADERTNSLLVFASKKDMEVIKDIIGKLDVVLAQVLIEAIIMEVTLDDTRSLGVSYLQNSPKGNNYFSGIGAIKNGNSPFANFSNFANAAGTNAANGLPGGFSYLANFGNDFSATVTAAANDNRINVISRPRIQTSHAVTANFQVGDTVPYVTGTYFGGVNGQASSQYQQTFVGINLQVTPLINPDGLVVMDIVQDIQQLGTPTVIDNNPVPTTTKRTASAKVSVRDRDTIILGGFISTTKSKSKSGVPFLKDIPGLGVLFRSSQDSNKRTELIVLLRPTVLPTPGDAAIVATRERDKLPGVKTADAENQADEARRQKQADRLQEARDRDAAKEAARQAQKELKQAPKAVKQEQYIYSNDPLNP
ncbi:MAG: Type and secretion system protein [Pedosphaera sp.]|nr:Type and secretion system protein [Pedosphaera sp.]